MHPAPSVILFTVLSGAGLGYLAYLGLGQSTGTGLLAFWQFALGLGMAVAGLLSSTFHLGNPQRSLLAFTQWRTSWLSREAWAAMASLLVMSIYAIAAIFWDRQIIPLGVLGAALCLATVGITSMIYAQMATLPRWNSPLTPVYFLATSLASGGILALPRLAAILLLAALGGVQLVTWWQGDRRFQARGHSMATATGLGAASGIRLFEAPHSGPNYLTKEFGFQVARRHAAKLRAISLALMSVLPMLVLAIGGNGAFIALAFMLHILGVLASRWLFFAEAEHVVQLYYGARAA